MLQICYNMAKALTEIYLHTYYKDKKNRCKVYLKVTSEGKRKLYKTDYVLTEKEFTQVMSEKPGKLKEIKLKLMAIEKKASDIIRDEMEFFSWEQFERLFQTNRGTKKDLEFLFNQYIDDLRSQKRIGTAVSYECARTSLLKFKSGAKLLDVTPAFLRSYEQWMLDKQASKTTIGIYLRSLRTIFNQCITSGLITSTHYPFHQYEIPTSENIKKALNIEDIGRIFHYNSNNEVTNKMKDYWLFMYLCNGINVKDMCLLKYSNIQGDFLEFNREKTIRTKRKSYPIRLAIQDRAKDIIQRRGQRMLSKDAYVFPEVQKGLTAERERQLIQQLTSLINTHMKAVAKDLKLKGPVTTYAARHSFATVLKRSGVSIEFISEALGHSNVKTTQNYLDKFQDEALKENTKSLTAFN